MPHKADLHIHTTCSDGKLSPEEVIMLAASKKLKTVSITDHDTFEGYKQARPFADEYGIELIPGVEVTTVFKEKEVHILAYYFETDTDYFGDFLNNQRGKRIARIKGIINTLNNRKIDVDYNEVWAEAAGGNLGRPHIAKILIDKGYVSSFNEAFELYLSNEKLGEIKNSYPTSQEAIQMIKNVGGAAILAHPGRLYSEVEIEEFINMGIDGLECIHPSHNFRKQEFYSNLCDKKSLLKTGGSDYHGSIETGHSLVGVVAIAEKYVASMKRMTDQRKQTILVKE
ncbi:MAG: PHP domain-containing protein [Balneola sp.]|nr:PHP domain-containing protein [Balneola sp.]MBO6651381.1 PHP domain-containing protein [Balneola sp.]MBO6710992.1 PHP domain-containing protein [Balneola sp.]MBO6801508.1 PHP domain-containing protein [Balneola sp.]MBO6870412.1 PHP domain-containing protein [Balneola sp.]